jgi:polysaccharide export outer membrane protein
MQRCVSHSTPQRSQRGPRHFCPRLSTDGRCHTTPTIEIERECAEYTVKKLCVQVLGSQRASQHQVNEIYTRQPNRSKAMKRIANSSISYLIPFVCLAALACALPSSQAADIPKTNTAPNTAEEYKLGPEDVLEVFVYKEPELSTTVTVRPDGRISLPLAGEIEARGKAATELQDQITEKLKKYISAPVVNVMVKQINSLKISVLGEVRKPDVYRIKNRVTVLDAIAMAGGFTDLARPTRVVVIRNSASGQQRIRINVNQVVADSSTQPFYLEPLDTVYVEGR